MSDLDDIESIAESTHFGTHPSMLFSGPRSTQHCHPKATCGRGHDLAVTGRWRRNGKHGRRRVCIECQRLTTGFKGIYKPKCEAT